MTVAETCHLHLYNKILSQSVTDIILQQIPYKCKEIFPTQWRKQRSHTHDSLLIYCTFHSILGSSF